MLLARFPGCMYWCWFTRIEGASVSLPPTKHFPASQVCLGICLSSTICIVKLPGLGLVPNRNALDHLAIAQLSDPDCLYPIDARHEPDTNTVHLRYVAAVFLSLLSTIRNIQIVLVKVIHCSIHLMHRNTMFLLKSF